MTIYLKTNMTWFDVQSNKKCIPTSCCLFTSLEGRVTSSYNITWLLPQYYYLLFLSWEIQFDKKKVVLLLFFFVLKNACLSFLNESSFDDFFFALRHFLGGFLHHTAHTTHTSHSTHAAHSTSGHASRGIFFDFSYNGLGGCQKWGHTTSIS